MTHPYQFRDRIEAGKKLAEELDSLHLRNPLVLALPRGGLPIAREVAIRLHAPLEVLIVRKIGAPYNPEYGIGAMCEDFHPLFNPAAMLSEEYYKEEIERIVADEKLELQRRINNYRGRRPLPRMVGKTVILIDDGVATGMTAAAAAKFLKNVGAEQVIIAAPVCPKGNDPLLEKYSDQIICLQRPPIFSSVGQWYLNFDQVSDAEVMNILEEFHPSQDERRDSL
jgi:putative phosphoribosyl transferase